MNRENLKKSFEIINREADLIVRLNLTTQNQRMAILSMVNSFVPDEESRNEERNISLVEFIESLFITFDIKKQDYLKYEKANDRKKVVAKIKSLSRNVLKCIENFFMIMQNRDDNVPLSETVIFQEWIKDLGISIDKWSSKH